MTPEPCTQEARNEGCTCRMSSVNSASIDPPEPVRDLNCPLHGNYAARDPDGARDQSLDDDADCQQYDYHQYIWGDP
jgi:hypothetical protein